MAKQPPVVFSDHPVVILDLPLAANTRLLQPEQVMLKIGSDVHDVGSFCYTLRSNQARKVGRSREVLPSSLRKDRVNQIRQLIETFSSIAKDSGMRPRSLGGLLSSFRVFMDWADANGCLDCLAGGEETQRSYRLYAQDVEDRFRRHEFQSANAIHLQRDPLKVLEAFTGRSDLGKGIRFVKNINRSMVGTEPVTAHSFAHVLALNDAMFQGMSDLVLNHKPFPFKLAMPKSLGWKDDFLWVFPTPVWILPPHQWGLERTKLTCPSWPQNYAYGKLATVDEIACHYVGSESLRKSNARKSVTNAVKSMEEANSQKRSHYRLLFSAVALKAFYFLFLAYTGANASVVRDIETDGTMEETTANPGYRGIKWRASAKQVDVIVPIAFVPALRRYMELRKYMLNGREFPFLFLSLGGGSRTELKQVDDHLLQSQYESLVRIDPNLPRMGVQKIRSTVSNYYKQKHDSEIEAAVMQHKKETAQISYDAGTEVDHHVELSLLMDKISEKAQQQIVAEGSSINTRPLEEGGGCESYGNPEPIASDVPVQPDCKKGCLFCTRRVLIAGEADTRKIASAAFLMEQLIMGPMSEAEFRPQIVKCDEDLAKIRAFEGCADMVDRVSQDVFENGNLTPYFADKFQFFLSLGGL